MNFGGMEFSPEQERSSSVLGQEAVLFSLSPNEMRWERTTGSGCGSLTGGEVWPDPFPALANLKTCCPAKASELTAGS